MTWQTRTIPLVGGMDQGNGEAAGGILQAAINCKIDRKNGISKRTGLLNLYNGIYSGAGSSLSLADIQASVASAQPVQIRDIINADNELLLITDKYLMTYVTDGWVVRDLIATSTGTAILSPTAVGAEVSYSFAGRNSYDHENVSVGTAGAYNVIAWVENGILYYSVWDTNYKVWIVDGKALGAGTTKYCFCVAAGDTVAIIAIEAANNLKCYRLTDVLVPAETTLKTTAYNTGSVAPLYACATGNGEEVAIAYRDTVGGLTVILVDLTAGTVTSTTTYATAGGVEAVCIENIQSKLVLACGMGTGASNVLTKVLSLTAVDQALNVSYTTSDSARRPIRFTVAGYSSYDGYIPALTQYSLQFYWQLERTGTQFNRVDSVMRMHTSTTTSTVQSYRHATLLSTAVTINGLPYVVMGHSSTLQGSWFLVATELADLNKIHIAAREFYGVNKGDVNNYGPPCPLVVSGDGLSFLTGAINKIKYDADAGDKIDFGRSTMVFGLLKKKVVAEKINNATYITCGSVVKQFDGINVVEDGMLTWPEYSDTAITLTGAVGALSAGSYSWRAYYEWTKGGQRMRSFALAVTKTVAANDRASIAVPTLRFTQKDANDVAIVVYRTKVNPTTESPFYRVTAYAPNSGGSNWYKNSFAADTVAVVDGAADTTIGDEEMDYLSQGVLARVQPDGIKTLIKHGERLIGASGKKICPSFFATTDEAVEFSDDAAVDGPASPGDIQALGVLGNKLVVFKERSIHAYTGVGLDNVGFGDSATGFSEPYTVSDKIGANAQGHVAKCPLGLMFAHETGIWLLDDGLNLTFVGKKIHDLFNDNYDLQEVLDINLIKAVHCARDNYVAFVGVDYTFVYFYLYDAWAQWDYSVSAINGATLHDGDLAISYGATVAVQTDGTYQDNSTNYLYRVASVELPIDGENGNGKGQLKSIAPLGRHQGGAAVTLGVSYDGLVHELDPTSEVPTYTGNYTVPSSPSQTVTPLDRSRFEYQPPKQKCSTFRFFISQTDSNKGPMYSQVMIRYRATGKQVSLGGGRRAT